jgi:hypothetical protein
MTVTALSLTVTALGMTAQRSRLCIVCLLLLAACASPEAARTRGDGPGADVGNRRNPVEIHAGAKPYHDTACVTESIECKGPPAVFGPNPPPD